METLERTIAFTAGQVVPDFTLCVSVHTYPWLSHCKEQERTVKSFSLYRQTTVTCCSWLCLVHLNIFMSHSLKVISPTKLASSSLSHFSIVRYTHLLRQVQLIWMINHDKIKMFFCSFFCFLCLFTPHTQISTKPTTLLGQVLFSSEEFQHKSKLEYREQLGMISLHGFTRCGSDKRTRYKRHCR